MKNSGEKQQTSKRKSRDSKNYLPVEWKDSEITIEILTRKKKSRKKCKGGESQVVVSSSAPSSVSSSEVKIKYPEKTKNKQTAIPSTDYVTRSTGGTGTKTVDSLGGACRFISNRSSKVLEAFTKQFKPMIPVYHSQICTCKKQQEQQQQQQQQQQQEKEQKRNKKSEPKKKKKATIKKPRKFCCKKKKKSESRVIICADSSNLGSSETLEPDPPNLCDCEDDADQYPEVFSNLNKHWVPCKCGRDCPANRRYILKKKTVTYTFCSTVNSWKPGFVKICCPICSSIDRPALKTVKTKNILAKTKFQASVLISCWPVCMLPFFMSQSAILLFCKVCHSYLGQYDKTLGCVKPPEIIKHHIAHLMPKRQDESSF